MISNFHFSRDCRSRTYAWQVGGGASLFILLILTGCISPRVKMARVPVAPQIVESAQRFKKEYVFAPADQIDVVVRRVPEASRSVTVRSDGYISLPIVNDVKAAGLTTGELRDHLTKLLSTRLNEPEVSIIPTAVRQPAVYVSGDVNNPVSVPLRDAPTAMQAIALAGGFKRTASERDVAIIRLADDGHVEAIALTMPSNGQPGPYMALRGLLLQADDIVFVPESGRSQMSRFLDDFINRPLQGVNSLVQTYVNFRLVTVLNKTL